MGMGDDQAALHIARLLERAPWHRLPAVALLRLTGILCYDIAQVGGRGFGLDKATAERQTGDCCLPCCAGHTAARQSGP